MISERVILCGIGIDNLTMDEAVARIGELVEGRTPTMVVTPNVDHLVRLQRDAEFRRAYRAAALVLPDGAPLLWAARYLRTPLAAKVSGSDLFPEVCRAAATKRHTLFLLGGRPGAASRAAASMERQYPGLRIVGTHCPPYGFEHDAIANRACLEAVRRTRPDILFAGLGSPKQEKWMHAHLGELGVPVCIGVGATFEFVAGIVRRAPTWMQTRGLEWLWRLLREPKRLWRRYLVDDPRFFWLVARQKATTRRAGAP